MWMERQWKKCGSRIQSTKCGVQTVDYKRQGVRDQSREHTAQRVRAHSAEHGVQSTDYIDYRGQGGEPRVESTRHRGCEPMECGAQTRLQRHRAGSTEQSVCQGQGMECRARSWEYRLQIIQRAQEGDQRVWAQGKSTVRMLRSVAYVAQHKLLCRECRA